ncbi:MAG: SEC-C domain-containing protein [Treponemataceae bacterium]
MRIWAISYSRGLRKLSKHCPQSAVAELREAAAACPARARKDLSRILYYLGLALERSGQPSLAVKSWASARRLERGGAIGRVFARWVNEYGMRRMQSRDLDDYCAFKAAQVARYLSKRGLGRFGSKAERDAVIDLITDSWRVLQKSGFLRGLTASRKMELFHRARVQLPFLYLEDALETPSRAITGDFRHGSAVSVRVKPDDRCPCGSGLPFRRCCGRQASCLELEYGSH